MAENAPAKSKADPLDLFGWSLLVTATLSGFAWSAFGAGRGEATAVAALAGVGVLLRLRRRSKPVAFAASLLTALLFLIAFGMNKGEVRPEDIEASSPIDVIELSRPDGEYKAMIYKLPKVNEADSDYRVVFYRKVGGDYVRHGTEGNLLNFERPHLSPGPEPRIETKINGLGVKYHFVVDAKGAEMVPSEALRDDGSLKGHVD